MEADETLALGRELMGGTPDDVRRLRPRLRRPVARRQRRQGALRRRACRTAAARPTEVFSNCRAGDGTPAPINLAKACWAGGTAQIYVNSTLPAGTTYEQVRTADHRRVPEPDRPGQPGRAGRAQDHEEGGAAQRRRQRLAPPEPQRRRRRRAQAAVPVRRGDPRARRSPSRSSSASTATCRRRSTSRAASTCTRRSWRPARASASRARSTGVRAVDLAPTIAFLLGIPGPDQRPRQDPLPALPEPGPLEGSDDPLHQRLPRPAHAAVADGRHRSARRFAHRRRRLPQAVVRHVPRRGDGRPQGGNHITVDRRRLRRRHARRSPTSSATSRRSTVLNMLGMTRRHARATTTSTAGRQYLRTELIPLANFPYLSANTVFQSNGKLPPEWKAVAGVQLRRLQARRRRLHAARARHADLPRLPRPVQGHRPGAAVNAEAARLRVEGQGQRGHRRRPHRRRRHATVTNPTGRAHRPRRRPDRRRRRHRRPHPHPVHRRTGRTGGSSPRTRTPASGSPAIRLTVDTIDEEGRLQDRRLPQAVGHRGHARPGDPGEDRRPEHAARADLQHGDRRLDGARSRASDACGRGRRAAVRVADRRPHDRCAADDLQHRLRDHELGRAAGRPDLPDAGHRRRLLPGLHAAAVPDHARPGARRAAVRQRRRSR